MNRLTVSVLGIILLAITGGRGSEPRPPVPHIPEATARAPKWLDRADLPFDLDEYLALPPDEENAAPLYLQALLEFDPDAARCFPDDQETERRRERARQRVDQWREIDDALRKNPGAVSAWAIDEIVKLHDAGFRSLVEAQKRPRCVFVTGLGAGSLLPHLQAARQVARIASLRTRRDLENGDFERPLRDFQMVLRLCRDLQPRGSRMSQLVSVAMTQELFRSAVLPFLQDPKIEARFCDRLIALIREHSEKSIDGYSESLKAEYLMSRIVLHDNSQLLQGPDPELAQKARRALAMDLLAARSETDKMPDPEQIRRIADRIAAITAEQWSAQFVAGNGLYHQIEALRERPYADRIRLLSRLLDRPAKREITEDLPFELTLLSQPDLLFMTQAFGRDDATLRAYLCLASVRRWQVVSRGEPPSLSAAVKAAGLPNVPLDPYDGSPLRMTVYRSRPAIYSVGKDGKDDGGRTDSDYDRRPGDLIYPLP